MQGPGPVRHATAVATVRAFAQAAGALRVVAVLDAGAAGPALIEWEADESLRVTEGDAVHEVGADAPAARPRPLADVRPAPASALTVDPDAGELAAPIGAVANLAEGVLSLARALGGRSVATADFATRDPELPLTIAGRDGEPIVLAVGGQQFTLPDGWPSSA